MSDLPVNSASVRVTGAYAGYMTKYEPEKRELEMTAAGVRRGLNTSA